MNIRDYIGEGTEYDKKEALEVKRPKSWLKSVSAFANGKGGVLLFGISDDNDLVGLKEAEGENVPSKRRNQVRKLLMKIMLHMMHRVRQNQKKEHTI